MFEYTIDPTANEPIMLILKQVGNSYDEHGNVTEYGINGEAFCRELLLLDSMGKSRIQIWINSVGGSVVDGFSILGAMLKSKTRVDTYNIGLAASTAGWLFLAGKNRDMSDYATWMGHNPSSPDGSDSEIRRKFQDAITHIVAQRTDKSNEDVAKMLDMETYMTASECFEQGLCDSISATSKQNIKRMKSAETIQDKYNEALLIVNQILPTKKKNNIMIENTLDVNITNALKLVPEASPAMVVKSISEIQNALIIEQGKVTTAEQALTIANKAKDDLQKKYDDLYKDMQEVKDLIEKEDEANRLKNATEMVNSFAELGKIENSEDVTKTWIDLAKVDTASFDRIKNMLTSLPVNKEAKKMEVTNLLSGNGGPKNLAQRMHEIANKNKQK